MGRVNRAFPNTFYYCYLSWNTQRESLRRRVYRSGEAFTSLQPGNSLHATLNRDYLGSVSIDDWGVTGQLKRYMVLLLTWKLSISRKRWSRDEAECMKKSFCNRFFFLSSAHSLPRTRFWESSFFIPSHKTSSPKNACVGGYSVQWRVRTSSGFFLTKKNNFLVAPH